MRDLIISKLAGLEDFDKIWKKLPTNNEQSYTSYLASLNDNDLVDRFLEVAMTYGQA